MGVGAPLLRNYPIYCGIGIDPPPSIWPGAIVIIHSPPTIHLRPEDLELDPFADAGGALSFSVDIESASISIF